jgi:hypothetical protein
MCWFLRLQMKFLCLSVFIGVHLWPICFLVPTNELEEVLEEWLLFRLSRQLPVPILDGMDLWDGPRGARGCLMPRIGPIRRKDFLFFLRQMGFEGPYAGRRDAVMPFAVARSVRPAFGW